MFGSCGPTLVSWANYRPDHVREPMGTFEVFHGILETVFQRLKIWRRQACLNLRYLASELGENTKAKVVGHQAVQDGG